MKKLLLAFALIAGSATVSQVAQAQISVNINIGRQPLWGPTGYDYVRYYYLPDVDAYYSVSDQQFIYNEGGRWVFRSSLPGRYRNFDLYNGYKVVVNDANPWLRNNTYARKYRSYRGRRGQTVIRDSRDQRYYEIADHPRHNEWRGNGNQDSRGNVRDGAGSNGRR